MNGTNEIHVPQIIEYELLDKGVILRDMGFVYPDNCSEVVESFWLLTFPEGYISKHWEMYNEQIVYKYLADCECAGIDLPFRIHGFTCTCAHDCCGHVQTRMIKITKIHGYAENVRFIISQIGVVNI